MKNLFLFLKCILISVLVSYFIISFVSWDYSLLLRIWERNISDRISYLVIIISVSFIIYLNKKFTS
jgi:hypothetical protein